MEVLIGLMILWAIVTVVGHATWVTIAFLFRSASSASQHEFDQEKADLRAASRVLDQLLSKGLITPREGARLRGQLRDLEFPPPRPTATRIADRTPPPPVRPTPVATQSDPNSVLQSSTQPMIVASVETDTPDEEIATATLVSQPSKPDFKHAIGTVQEVSVAEVATLPPEPPKPALSRAEIIHSFLAAHNIRWGELVAGILIVVCSIGLVVSLWSTLIDTHRVIPSLIFLTANSAIFAAGLYTLSRWRLRHTSRAVLVIASLLVPLSVLAGLAAAGKNAAAVALNDPITLASIFGGGLVYIFLLWRGSRALVGRIHAVPLTLSVAGSASLLPFVPAAIRSFDGNAAWMIGGAAIALMGSAVWMVKRTSSKRSLLSVTGGRNRIMLIALGTFAISVLAGYVGFAIHTNVSELSVESTLPIAIALIPALIGLAGAGRSLSLTASRAAHAMVGTIVCVLCIGGLAAMLPAAMVGMNWLWAWAIAISVAGILIGMLLKQPRWLPIATVPVGIAASFSSPVWISGLPWEETQLWRRIVGGEPMLAAALIAIVVFALSRVVRDQDSRKWLLFGSGGWICTSGLIAAMLTFAPIELLASVPWWAVTAVLATGTFVSVAAALDRKFIAFASVAGATLTWFSMFRPVMLSVPITSPMSIEPTHVWMWVGLLISATLMTFSEVAQWIRRASSVWSSQQWCLAAVAAGTISAAFACFLIGPQWEQAAAGFFAISGILFWAATNLRSPIVLGISQASSAAFACVLTYAKFTPHDALPWTWAVMGCCIVATWLLIRELYVLVEKRGGEKHILLQPESCPFQIVDGGTLLAVVVLIALGAGWTFCVLVSNVVPDANLSSHEGLKQPILAMISAGGMLVWVRRHADELGHSLSTLALVVLGASLAIWTSWQFASYLFAEHVQRLVAGTTIAAIGCTAIGQATSKATNRRPALMPCWSSAVPVGIAHAISLALVVTASTSMLVFDWISPLLDGKRPDTFATWSVAAWWLAAAVGLLWAARITKQAWLSCLSAVFAPAAIGLLAPLYMQSHFASWIQVAAIASSGWALAVWWFCQADSSTKQAINGSLGFTWATGVVSAVLAIACILFNVSQLSVIFGPASLTVTLIAAFIWHQFGHRLGLGRLPWPIAITGLSGQITWLGIATGVITTTHALDAMATVWMIGAVASMIEFHRRERSADFWHAITVSVGVMITSIALVSFNSNYATWLGIAASVIGGLFVTASGRQFRFGKLNAITNRIFGCMCVLLGGILLAEHLSNRAELVIWSAIIMWIAVWLITWRASCPDHVGVASVNQSVPEMELSILILLAAIGEFVVAVVYGSEPGYFNFTSDYLGWLRVACWFLVGCTVILRGGRFGIWQISGATLIATLGYVVARFAIDNGAITEQRIALGSLSSGFTLSVIALWLPGISKACSRLAYLRSTEPLSDRVHILQQHRLTMATTHLVLLTSVVVIVVSIGMIVNFVNPPVAYLTIGGLALATWALWEIADLTNRNRIRHVTVTLGLIALGLFASVTSPAVAYPFLTVTMRWFMVATIATGSIVLLLPKLLGQSITARWNDALRRGAVITTVAAIASLLVMFVTEAIVRSENGIEAVPRPMIIVVAVTLAGFSLMCGLMAIFSGPGFRYREIWSLSDNQRRGLIIGSQAMGFLTWLHLFLCKTEWAFVGLRAYWPYVVMSLAFVSVGATEWAKRRSDKLLSDTLKQTALYLPLIPVFGFWLSGLATDWGAFEDWSWAFVGDRVPYAVLLTLGAIYYAIVSAMWRGITTRVAAVVLGNAALWTVLVQSPGWGFLSHPQLWLIPPAVCVLIVAHLYRDQLQPALASAIRYVTTLVIYISSTADMLIQDIGSSISGPIILVALALLGMLLGVVLRVKPFLYLGAIFVFVGVTSMVSHAHQQIGAVWPWWVFGITTGIGLLVVLTMIEKNKPKLREYANRLSAWDT